MSKFIPHSSVVSERISQFKRRQRKLRIEALKAEMKKELEKVANQTEPTKESADEQSQTKTS